MRADVGLYCIRRVCSFKPKCIDYYGRWFDIQPWSSGPFAHQTLLRQCQSDVFFRLLRNALWLPRRKSASRPDNHGGSRLVPVTRCGLRQGLLSGLTCKFDWTLGHNRAVLSVSMTPGTSGLHSVQGEGLAFAHRVEKHHDNIRDSEAKDSQTEDGCG